MEDLPKLENKNKLSFLNRNTISREIFLFLFFLIFLSTFFYFFLFSSPNNFPNETIVSIEKGESLRNLSFDLKNKNIIRSRVAFESFVILFGGEKHISPGDYMFENKLPVFEVARRIAFRDKRLASVVLTIPEGFDNLQIGDTASAKLKNFNKKNFLEKAKIGYLFPDTYFFFSSDDENEVLKSMNNNFQRKINPIEQYIASSGKSLNDIITMASLVEKEAKGDEDRGYIAGILWNRIKRGMPLQVDANMSTYKNKGLPSEPICNPGMDAIRASLYPTASNFLYYLHDKNGQIHFAKTFEEHKINKAKYLKN